MNREQNRRKRKRTKIKSCTNVESLQTYSVKVKQKKRKSKQISEKNIFHQMEEISSRLNVYSDWFCIP